MFKLLPLVGLLLTAAPALAAHPYAPYPHTGAFFVWNTGYVYHPRQPKVRLDEHCVWKPWKQKVVCKY